MKETSRATSAWRNEEQQDYDSVEQHSSAQFPGAQAQYLNVKSLQQTVSMRRTTEQIIDQFLFGAWHSDYS